jgi:heme exporter protein CcmD
VHALSEFLYLDGYGIYVWPAVGFAVVVLAALLAQSWRLRRDRLAELESLRAELGGGRPRRRGDGR